MEADQQHRQSLGHVVVIGGNGFLGHHIVNQALTRWKTQSVTSIDVQTTRNRQPQASYRECDITDQRRLTELLREIRPDVVMHTASPVASGEQGSSSRLLFRRVNVDGTRCVVEACKDSEVKALVYTSSASVVSDNRSSDLFNVDESRPTVRGKRQHEYYSETKAAAEELVLAANRNNAAPPFLLTTSLRPAGIFGEGDVQLLPGLLRAYRDGKTNVQIGDNNNIFDFTYVGNVAHAHLLASHALLLTSSSSTTTTTTTTTIQPLHHEKVDGEVFFITNDSPCYFWDFARAVWREAGHDRGTDGVWVLPRGVGVFIGVVAEAFCRLLGLPPFLTRQRAVISTLTRYYNISKAKSVLRYEPLWSLGEGISRSLAWFREQDKSILEKTAA
ncbi:hypothetical protein L249_5788 [Ophiocordyceps polyrhachis-furcata BCC 54312]|uniref:3-beta hydroxysteroid dehydrogenase/isomerase domain-containing protein n=1 Tax=Ophiocordyceps polyrhachis-furcata BCC 54312 TaxID=1330021 RepID=A0A367L0E0_9HYPO|nr:hypothetical protein L249_5788 [Ophiocordyceps polyrhachis-furcata BCC 54312]